MNFSYTKMFRNGLVLKFYADASNSGWAEWFLPLTMNISHCATTAIPIIASNPR